MSISSLSLPPPDSPSDTELTTPELRRMLEECRQEREALLTELAPVASPNVDPVAFVRAEATRQTIAQIDAALGRILDGTYGRCVHCGQAIPPARLELRPFTAGCVGCEEKLARGR
jgi:DnaK suppressor protein